MFTNVSYEVLGPVARILHNRPDQRNAENSLLLKEMDEALKLAGEDDQVRVVIIGGVGDHFSAGHDLKEAQARRYGLSVEDRWAYEEEYYFGYCMNIWDFPKPTIAQVQGACVAGAFMVANMCDLIVASEDAVFCDPVLQTLAAPAVEVLVHPWVLGLRKAKELLYTGERISAEEGMKMGMINRVVPRADLESATLALGNKIAQASPFALKLLKRSLNRTADMQGFRNALQAHFDTHQLGHVGTDHVASRAKGAESSIAHAKVSSAPVRIGTGDRVKIT